VSEPSREGGGEKETTRRGDEKNLRLQEAKPFTGEEKRKKEI